MQDGHHKLNRTRRNLFRALGIVAGATMATSVPREADAQLLCQILNNCPSGGTTCFLRGTPIATPEGYRAVETLVGGDRVVARFAGAAQVDTVRSFSLPAAEAWTSPSRPVRIKAGALTDSSPRADICLTGSHGIFVDGAIVPVVNLVNGTSIVFEPIEPQQTFGFFHIVLARHDILDVDGAPCESFLDPTVEAPCVPLLSFNGGRDQLRSRLRSAASLVFDRREPLDVIRDRLEERGLQLARAA